MSEEAETAGKNAWAYVQGELTQAERIIVETGFGVGALVPQLVSREPLQPVRLMFRPRNVYRNARIIVEAGEQRLYEKKAMILAPGEMVNVVLPVEKLSALKNAESLTVRIEVSQA